MDVGEEEETELELSNLRRGIASLQARATDLTTSVAHSGDSDQRQQRILQLAELRARIDSLAAQVRETEDRVALAEARGELSYESTGWRSKHVSL